jgi:hypothetical protein
VRAQPNLRARRREFSGRRRFERSSPGGFALYLILETRYRALRDVRYEHSMGQGLPHFIHLVGQQISHTTSDAESQANHAFAG